VLSAGAGGTPFVCVHAIGLDREMWRGVLERLGASRRALSYDVRGHGCAAGAPKPFSSEGFADDLRDLLDALGIEQAHIVGASMGGAIAQEMALRHPERVSGLSLICTMAAGSPVYNDRADDALARGVGAQVQSTLERWFAPAVLAAGGAPVRYARERLAALDVEDWAAAWRALAGVRTLERLPAVRVPTQVIAAELDPSTPPAAMAEIARRLTDARSHVIPGGGHMVVLEQPAAVAALLSA
jgi:3-oxoadipate enol-lactonase